MFDIEDVIKNFIVLSDLYALHDADPQISMKIYVLSSY